MILMYHNIKIVAYSIDVLICQYDCVDVRVAKYWLNIFGSHRVPIHLDIWVSLLNTELRDQSKRTATIVGRCSQRSSIDVYCTEQIALMLVLNSFVNFS
jgi:hypothetical protein